jgi:hypothetical protein
VIMWKAYFAIIWGLPSVIRKRRRIRTITVVSPAEIASWFKRFGLSASELVLKD